MTLFSTIISILKNDKEGTLNFFSANPRSAVKDYKLHVHVWKNEEVLLIMLHDDI